MEQEYQKIKYESQLGFSLHHTVGRKAGDSTLGYSHCHFTNMLIYFIHGSGSIRIEGRHYDIREGDVILLNPTELFHCKVDPNVYHERIVLYIRDSILTNLPGEPQTLLAPFTEREKGIGNQIAAQTVRANGLDKLLGTLLKLFQYPYTNSELLALCKTVELLIQLNQAFAPGQDTGIVNHDNPLIDEVLTYINSHYHQNISVSYIAESLCIHKSYLSHLFAEQVGMSLWNYVILRRLHAFNMLVRQGNSLEEACYQVGFQNYSNFFRLYKKHMGMTPMEYKKKQYEQ